jgi:hypothetical protein
MAISSTMKVSEGVTDHHTPLGVPHLTQCQLITIFLGLAAAVPAPTGNDPDVVTTITTVNTTDASPVPDPKINSQNYFLVCRGRHTDTCANRDGTYCDQGGYVHSRASWCYNNCWCESCVYKLNLWKCQTVVADVGDNSTDTGLDSTQEEEAASTE